MTSIKVCGLKRKEDAELAIELGAAALGFIFHRPSPRFIEPEEARDIISGLDASVRTVGVFVDWPVEELNAVIRDVGLTVAQLHGAESVDYATEVEAREVWKAFRVKPEFEPRSIDAYSACDGVLLDAYRAGQPGGTGETFDWSVAREVQSRRPIILAGGLSPANVARAVREVEPSMLDVSSGVEDAPGVKNHSQLRELFNAVAKAR